MILQPDKIFSYIFLLIPLFLITGPAVPDIVITFGALFGIIYFRKTNIKYKSIKLFINSKEF